MELPRIFRVLTSPVRVPPTRATSRRSARVQYWLTGTGAAGRLLDVEGQVADHGGRRCAHHGRAIADLATGVEAAAVSRSRLGEEAGVVAAGGDRDDRVVSHDGSRRREFSDRAAQVFQSAPQLFLRLNERFMEAR